MLERPEVVDDLILYQLQPESKLTPEDSEETQFRGGWYADMEEDTDKDSAHSRTSEDYEDEHLNSTDQELRNPGEGGRTDLDNEIAMLIYKNRLVMGSP